MVKTELNSMNLKELREFMVDIGQQSFRGEQVFTYFNKNMKLNIEDLLQLPRDLRNKLEEDTFVNKPSILKRYDSKIDKTKKYLFLLEDDNIVEGVFMEYPHGISVCISTQVGCKMGCSFCASTKGGLIRNLTPSEMLNQIYLVEKELKVIVSNIVLMGSGEPLDNYENVIKFLNIIHDPKGHNTSYRNITLSTCGIPSKIYDLAKENLPITLSISLHSPFDEERSKIMPISKGYTIKELMEACRHYEKTTSRRLTFEYTLIEGVNDREIDAEEISKITRGLNCHFNLIPLNPIAEYDKKSPEPSSVERFQKKLYNKNINATIRQEKGSDINASCGQLRRDYLNKD